MSTLLYILFLGINFKIGLHLGRTVATYYIEQYGRTAKAAGHSLLILIPCTLITSISSFALYNHLLGLIK